MGKIKSLLLVGGIPALSMMLGVYISFAIYKHDETNAAMLVANMIALGCFISFYLIAFKGLNILLAHSSRHYQNNKKND